MSHATSVIEALRLAQSATMIILQSVRTAIAEGAIGATLQMAAWIPGKLLSNLDTSVDDQLTLVAVVHLLSVIKTIASRAPVTRVRICS